MVYTGVVPYPAVPTHSVTGAWARVVLPHTASLSGTQVGTGLQEVQGHPGRQPSQAGLARMGPEGQGIVWRCHRKAATCPRERSVPLDPTGWSRAPGALRRCQERRCRGGSCGPGSFSVCGGLRPTLELDTEVPGHPPCPGPSQQSPGAPAWLLPPSPPSIPKPFRGLAAEPAGRL